ncbi:hypothetical protein CGLAU_00405 [Corynebacterium glaucum]|uniref:Serine hydrolase n=1 Tax=Corynebacterium glaucum TaxID=187491 RepID=A0A1Q2HTB1_9CORY|nr:hypothetical protein [Corynebacterium glaucum]AQQ14084.1 hypothetical protein CGLAU_00405 [Corynebacterium glaucum]WJZ06606.1 hypothetical protein CGLAUT_00420 [Corynebacterium glaucum]
MTSARVLNSGIAAAVVAMALLALMFVAAPAAHAYHVDPSYNRERTALAVVHPDGRVSISPTAEEQRPALSLSKLYLGYYVLYHGTAKEKGEIKEMLTTSDDAIATRLDAKYPEGIDKVAKDFDLDQTKRNGYWGKTQTSARDVATFIAAIVWDPRAKPLFRRHGATGRSRRRRVHPGIRHRTPRPREKFEDGVGG